jgi:hypothetical protein
MSNGEIEIIAIDEDVTDTVSCKRMMPFPINRFMDYIKWIKEESDRIFIQDSKINLDKLRSEWCIGCIPLDYQPNYFYELQNLHINLTGYDLDIKKENERFVKAL